MLVHNIQDIKQKLADAIVFHRAKANMTQESLADLVGLSTTTIRYIESGRRETLFSTVVRIAQVLDFELNELA